MITLTELEDTLAADPHGSRLAQLQAVLETEAAALGREQRQPQGAAAYARLERQRLACLAAMRILDTVWQRQHGKLAQFR